MNKKQMLELLNSFKKEEISVEEVLENLNRPSYGELGYAKIDHDREIRNGYPEVIYCEGKSIDHIKGIIKHMLEKKNVNILATRANREMYEAIREITDSVEYHELARIVIVKRQELKKTKKNILVVTGGTADIPVAEEAVITAEVLGNTVERLYDVGVAGIHRLLSNTDVLFKANVIIAVAGMEGALVSVVGGLVDKPVIGVPTSVGYGSSFGGVSALLSMLNSCSSGVSVVNIDNGFGAGYLASMINQMSDDVNI